MTCESVAEQAFLTAWHSKPRECTIASQYSPGWAWPRRFDFGLSLDGLTVCVEIDGRAWHSDARSFRIDRQKDRLAVQNGSVVLRFAADEALYHGDDTAAEAEQLALAFIVPRRLRMIETSETPQSAPDFTSMIAEAKARSEEPSGQGSRAFGASPLNFAGLSHSGAERAPSPQTKRVRRTKEQIAADGLTEAQVVPAESADLQGAKRGQAKDIAAALREIMLILDADSDLSPIVRTQIDVPHWWAVLVHDSNDRASVALQNDSVRCLAGLYLVLSDLLSGCREDMLLEFNDWSQLQKDISAAEIHEKYEIDSLAETDSAGFLAARSASADNLAILLARLRRVDGRRRAQQSIADDLEESLQAIDKVRQAHAKYLG